ncbi:uncharacterized protein LTR77_009077 [Saxophila tyrrhenica]|uniref:Protamine P1 n=1 Tax=Saxophila tyrrhenica TaxID=1690608 RepID=A0AAV9NZL4_9PEZI|nr:hypothetical protein LTR77_009077 [Saxophila tyrrhenica]
MIRTHKPRGHFWTNASAFQQSEDFREISFEECTPPPTRTYFPGPEEKLSATERSAKRRRIEQLADGFLNGEPLYITSARPCPEAQRRTIVWNKKSSNEPKFVLPEVDHLGDAAGLWEDVEDELEILRRAAQAGAKAEHEVSDAAEDHGVIEEQASASCGKSKRLRPAYVSAGPSEEALRIAAALRLRKTRQLQDTIQSDPVYGDHHFAHQKNGAPPASHSLRQTPEPSEQRSVWLSRRMSNVPLAELGDESLDELRLSRIDTPSRQLRKLQQAADSSPRTHGMMLRKHTSPRSDHSTPAEVTTIQETVTPVSAGRSRHSLRTVPRSSRGSAVGDDHGVAHDSTRNAQASSEPTSTDHVDSSGSADRGSTRESGQCETQELPTHRPLVTPMQPSLPDRTTGPHHYSPRVYAGKEAAQNGSTPFVFRKRGSGIDTGPAEGRGHENSVRFSSLNTTTKDGESDEDSPRDPAVVVLRRPMKFLSQPASLPRKAPPKSISGLSTAETPRCTSEPPTTLQTADTPSPAEVYNTTKSRLAGLSQFWPGTQVLLNQAQQDFFDLPEKQVIVEEDDPPSTRADETSAHAISRPPLKQLSQEPMQSTQAMLAAFEGFSTIKKPRGNRVQSPILTPTVLRKAMQRDKDKRSLTFSMEEPNGTSTYGKPQRPESCLRHSITSTDTLTRPDRSATFSEKMESSLRLTAGISSTELDTPASMPLARSSLESLVIPSPTAKATSQPLPTAHERSSFPSFGESTTDESLPTNPLDARRRPAATVASQSFVSEVEREICGNDSFEEMSSYQAAQREASMTESQLGRTIDELDLDVLSMGEMDGVLSQG